MMQAQGEQMSGHSQTSDEPNGVSRDAGGRCGRACCSGAFRLQLLSYHIHILPVKTLWRRYRWKRYPKRYPTIFPFHATHSILIR